MWEYLSKLHPLLPYSLTLITIIAIVIIALKGRLMVKWGKNTIGIGSGGSDNDADSLKKASPTTSIPISPTCSERKRSCSDCSQIMINEYEKYEFNKRERADKVLTYRMNFSEEKLVEFEADFTDIFEKRLSDLSKNDPNQNTGIESKLFYGLFRDSISRVKGEIRKSFKENGFCELSDSDFNNYVKDKTKLILSVLNGHLKSIYPRGTLVPIDDILSDVESTYTTMYDYINDIFTYAKKVINDNEEDTENKKKQFDNWKQEFIK